MTTKQDELRKARLDLMEAQDELRAMPAEDQQKCQEIITQLMATVKANNPHGLVALAICTLATQVAVLEEGI
ncbi:hypothetical protein PJWF_00058 [Achromobacter phage JWF]|uniref:hypothetical protein n=1 Tax=Achromobacter phage JWF TaxID=1589748 RepID=UPI000588E705|nr:hypothetical protein AXJ13_gp058 [Achromobacter phage JWF]AJD82952.1 hypothetical protein PJWF_00058 [Achromobacter phage JWF]